MPVYNSEKYLSFAIESVLAQSYSNIELIIVDDCSSDNSFQIISDYSQKDPRIRVIRNLKNLGCAFCRNLGINYSNGEFVAFIDSDDVWLPSKLVRQIKFLNNTDSNMAYTSYEIIDTCGLLIKKRYIEDLLHYDDLLRENSVIFSTTIFRVDCLKTFRFQDKWYHEDYVFLLDYIRQYGYLSGINEVLVKYRVHSQGRSFNKLIAARFRWRIYRDYLQLGFLKSFYFYVQYAFNGWRKYK